MTAKIPEAWASWIQTNQIGSASGTMVMVKDLEQYLLYREGLKNLAEKARTLMPVDPQAKVPADALGAVPIVDKRTAEARVYLDRAANACGVLRRQAFVKEDWCRAVEEGLFTLLQAMKVLAG